MLANKLMGGSAADKLYVDDVFSTYLYTGNGSTQTINNGIDLAGEGGLVWIKRRDSAQPHALFDTSRGTGTAGGGNSKILSTNNTAVQGWQNPSGGTVSAFNSNGFTVLADFSATVNASTSNEASWTFRKAPKFFDVRTISHTNGVATNITLSDLGALGQVIAKITNATGDWIVWHRSLTAGNNLRLNTTAAQTTTNAWLSVSGTTATLSASAPTGSYVIYAFAHDPSADGMIQCGSAFGDQSQINLGWEPQYILCKLDNGGTDDWRVYDTMRGISIQNGMNGAELKPNTSSAESAVNGFIKINATGFSINGISGGTYIYLAIRRPNKPPKTGLEVYNAIARTGTSSTVDVAGIGFAPDLAQIRSRAGDNWLQMDRLRGTSSQLNSASTAAEGGVATILTAFGVDRVTLGNSAIANSSGINYINHFFKRAPGFFDVVCFVAPTYNTSGTFQHNLGVVPEMIITKNRVISDPWTVYVKPLGADVGLRLNATIAAASDADTYRIRTTPTASTFSYFSPYTGMQESTVAYLFASLPGISKVGSYTGNGSSQTINCGFSTGARFILIKRTDSTGDWYVWDSARGIVAANDPHLSLNTTATEVTTDDSVDPDNSGFIVNQVAATNINVNNATYIYLAIA